MKSRAMLVTGVAFVVLIAAIVYFAFAQADTPKPTLQLEQLESGETTGAIISDETTETLAEQLTTRRDAAVAAQSADTDGDDTTADEDAASADENTNPVAEEPADADGVRFGLTIEQREQCYYDIIAAEDRAVAEAEAQYPLDTEDAEVASHVALRIELLDRYEQEVLDEYGITADQLDAIVQEGIQNGWPMPPLE